MQDFRGGKPTARDAAEPVPVPAATTALTASTKRTQPQAFDRTLELPQTLVVAGDGVEIVPSLDDTAQPPADIAKLPVHTSTQLLFDG